jgi:hypothetical protein
VFFLMGPGHGLYGWRSGRARAALEAQLAGNSEVAAS